MVENFDINLLLSPASSNWNRGEILTRILSLVKPWFGEPVSLAKNEYVSRRLNELAWEEGRATLDDDLKAGCLLHVYGQEHFGGRTSLTIDESSARTVYVIGVPVAFIATRPEAEFDSTLWSLIVSAASMFEDAILVAGSELTIDSEIADIRQTLRNEMGPQGSAEIVIARGHDICEASTGWHRFGHWADFCGLKRHEHFPRIAAGI